MYSAFYIFFVLGALTTSIGASLPELEMRFGADHAVGNIVIFYNLGALTATVIIGIIGQRVAARRVLWSLLGIFIVGTAGMGFSAGWSAYLSFATITGIGYGGMTLLLNTAFARGFGDMSVIMLSRLNAVFGIGAMVGPLAVAAAARIDVRLLPVAACVVSVAAMRVGRAGVALEVPSSMVDRPKTSGQSRPLKASVILLFVVGLLYAGTETGIGTWQSTQLVRSGWDMAAAVTAASGFWAGMALGRFIIPKLTRQIPAETAVPIYLSGAVAMLLLASVPHVAVIAYPIVGLFLAPTLPTLIGAVSSLVSIPQRATATLTLCCMLGNAIIPAAVQGLAGTYSGAEIIPFALAGSCIACLSCALVLRWNMRGRRKSLV